MKISSLNIYHSCCCVCSDGISYPNKYGFELFNNQLSTQIDKFTREYHPEWANPYRYDFYFEINVNNLIKATTIYSVCHSKIYIIFSSAQDFSVSSL